MGFGENDAAFFEPHELKSLIPIDSMDSLSPLTDAVVCFTSFNGGLRFQKKNDPNFAKI